MFQETLSISLSYSNDFRLYEDGNSATSELIYKGHLYIIIYNNVLYFSGSF